MYTFVLYSMFFSSWVSFFLGSNLGYLVPYLNSFSVLLSLIFVHNILFDVFLNHFIVNVRIAAWFYDLNMYFNFEFVFDAISSMMLYIILIISFFVHIFSIFYMKSDPNYNKFFFYLTLFTLFMSVLVLSNNFIQFFLGWEGIGLCSYLLINFWGTRLEANRAAIKAMILNKIGDCFLYLFFIFYFFIFDSFDINFISLLSINFINFYFFYFNVSIYDFMTLLLIIAACAKSAQLGLHVWLPDAMEGPTPVSSLLHAATMVTAGVYLLLKTSWILDLSNFMYFISIIGCLTNFFTSIIAIFQYDLKKVIAYSTASQISLMFIAIGCSGYNLAFFHLFNHAFFKALLFLAAGSIIHNFNNVQDSRYLKNIQFKLPLTYSTILIGQMSLIGFPFLSGYYSKDLIIFFFATKLIYINYIVFWFLNISVFFTVFYSFRLINSVFFKNFNILDMSLSQKYNEFEFFSSIPLIILSFFSIFSGYLFLDIFANKINYYFKNIFIFNFNEIDKISFFNFLEFSDLKLIFFVLIGGVIGFNVDFIIKIYNFFFNKKIYSLFVLFFKKIFFDNLYYYLTIYFFNLNFNFIYKNFDKVTLEYQITEYFILLIKNKTNIFSLLEKGQMFFYIFIILFFIFFIFFLYFFIQLPVVFVLILIIEFCYKK